MPATKKIFISHISDEAQVAAELKTHLNLWLGPDVEIFVSSDYESIRTGIDWFEEVTQNIITANAVIILLSEDAVSAKWINFESGMAHGSKREIFPVTIRGLSPACIDSPLKRFNIRPLNNGPALIRMVQSIAELLGMPAPTPQDVPKFIARIGAIESNLPIKNILIDPFLFKRPSDYLLRFRLSNSGNRDVELLQLEIKVPIRAGSNEWVVPNIPGVVSFEQIGPEDKKFALIKEYPFEGAVDLRFGKWNPLPRTLSPHMSPRLSDIKIPLQQIDDRLIEYCLIGKGVRPSKHVRPLSEIALEM